MEIIIDGNKITDKETLFQDLKSQIKSSEFYGRNLDALWDVLLSVDEELSITVINYSALEKNLGEYAKSLVEVFRDLTALKRNVVLSL